MPKNNEPSFFEQVYQVARLIPYGRVTSYGAIAGYLGSKGSARMVGWAMNNAHQQNEPVPTHRVVNRNGMLSGKQHFGGNIMQELLENEGAEIIDDQIINFKEKFWKPEEI